MVATTYVNNGSWRTCKQIYINDGGTWRDCSNVYVNDSGTWREVFTRAVDVVSVSAGVDINTTVADNTGNWPQVVGSSRACTPSPTDDGNYTYSWTKLSTVINNGRPLSTGVTNAATIAFSVNLDIPTQSSDKERWQIQVTDGLGNSVTDTLDVQYTSQDSGS